MTSSVKHWHGVNLGGWLMPEAYIMQAPNQGVHVFEKAFVKAYSRKELDVYQSAFRDTFIQRKDIERIAAWGFNCVRVPFHYKLFASEKRVLSEAGFVYLDRVMKWCGEFGVGVILDFHGAPGSQNYDWHSDSDGTAKFWSVKRNRDQAVEIWRTIAQRYHTNTHLIGYDLLNEAVVQDVDMLNAFYKQAITAIRKADTKHTIILQGNHWATDLACLDLPKDDDLMVSAHYYEPVEATFHLVPNAVYPLKKKGKVVWGKEQTSAVIRKHADAARKHKHPLFIGEFGVNAREGQGGEDVWLKDALKIFKQVGAHWTYWTYKAIKNHMFPDGLISYYPNDPWVARHDAVSGWNTHVKLWGKHKKDIIRSWDSDGYEENKSVTGVLRDVCRSYNQR